MFEAPLIIEATVARVGDLDNSRSLPPMHFRNRDKKYREGPGIYKLDPNAQNNDQAFSFSVRKLGDERLLYFKPTSNYVLQYGKSLGLFFFTVIHNIFVKCIKVLFIKLFAAMGVKFSAKDIKLTDAMWNGGSAIKGLLVMVPQIFLYLASILTFGLFSTEINRVCGDLERWSVGDSMESMRTLTRNFRGVQKDYMALCEQPYCTVSGDVVDDKVDYSFKTGKEDVCMSLEEVIPRDFWRSIVPFITNPHPEDEMPSNLKAVDCNFNSEEI